MDKTDTNLIGVGCLPRIIFEPMDCNVKTWDTIVKEKEGKLLYKRDRKGRVDSVMYKIDEDVLF